MEEKGLNKKNMYVSVYNEKVMKGKRVVTGLVLVMITVLILGWVYFKKSKVKKATGELELVLEVSYLCDEKKTIKANYFNGSTTEVKSGEMPVPNGEVDLVLSDDRQMNLKQTISASGIRYATADESMIFWSKGETAFIVENDKETFSDCKSLGKGL